MSLTGEDLSELCSPSYLDGLDEAPVTDLRQRRDACQHAELVLSYVRRVIQGEIDLVLAELALRADGGVSDIGRLVEELPSILASPAPTGAEPAHLPIETIAAVSDSVQDLDLEELFAQLLSSEQVASGLPGGLLPGANLCTFSEAELRTSLGRLQDEESSVSKKRRVLHEHIDDIQAAIVDRYKSGAADPDALLA
ncbi:MAG: RsiG family protein [Acidimicrobiales bacterium]